MTRNALIFGSIGTLVETSDLQRRAFNAAFAEAGLDWRWEPAEYRSLLRRSGGRERIAEYAETKGVNVDAARLHQRKSELFANAMIDEGLSLRPGVHDAIVSAQQAGWALAWATTTSRANVDAILTTLGGALDTGAFQVITDVSQIDRPKPDPEVYRAVMAQLGVAPEYCIAIEDTPVSLQSAADAGVPCIAFPGEFADRDEFDGALSVVDRLRFDTFAVAA